jgi:uncharacterized protein YgiM (DUF1202 family)
MNHGGTDAMRAAALAALLALAANAGAAESGSMRMAAPLYAAPYTDAKIAGQLAANAAVVVYDRRGAWLKITTADKRSGWVRMHQVRIGQGGAQKSTGEGLGMLRNVAETGRSGSHGIVATTGVRGLSAQDLKNARPNPKAVQMLDGYKATPEAARAEARSAGLHEQNVNFLPDTK